ncbi:MAG: translocation/assembly module TamB domain-containing protein [Bacteroidota bacterium]
MTLKKILTKSLKIVLWTVATILSLLVLIILLVQIPAIQNKIKDKAVTYLEDKIHTKVEIGYINIGFPKSVKAEKVYLESQSKDTLLYVNELVVDISLFKLIDNELEFNSIDLKGINANIIRTKGGVYNFDYIIKAFASKEKQNPEAKPMLITLNKINLDKINVKFDDAVSQNDLKFYFNHFETKFDKFDLDKMQFDIPNIKLDGLNMKLKQSLVVKDLIKTSKELTDEDLQHPLKLKLGTVELSKIKFSFTSPEDQLKTDFGIGKLNLKVREFDIQKEIIDLENLDINSLKAILVMGKTKQTKVTEENQSPSTNWVVKIDKTDLKRIDFKFDDLNKAPSNRGMDYAHLDFKDFNLNSDKLNYTSKSLISGNINQLSVQEKSGLDIQSLKTDFYYSEKTASLKKLYLKTPRTLLKNEIIISYPSIESLSKNIEQTTIDASLLQSRVGFKDILIFAPTLYKTNPFKSNPNAIININSRISGKLNNLQFPVFEISGIGNTRLAASGRIIGLPNAEKANFNVAIRNFQSTSQDIYSFVPAGTIPNTIQLPKQLSFNGTFKGTIKDFYTNLKISSSFGSAKIIANFDQTKKDKEVYKADAEFFNFDLGSLIKNEAIGKISLDAKVNGVGLNPKTANATVDAKIKSAQYNQYTYKNAKLKGAINKGVFKTAMFIKDPNLTLDLTGNGNFKDKYPAVKVKMNVDVADLEKLNLHAGPLKLKGQLDADFPDANLDYLNGKINIHHFRFANATEEFALDSIKIIAETTPEKNSIQLKSQFLDANVTGKYKLNSIADALSNSVAKYYNTNPSALKPKTPPQQFVFDINAKDNPLLFKLIPELKTMDPFVIKGRYNSANDTIVINGSIPKIIYGTNTISNAVFKVDTKENALVYSIVVNDIQNSQFQLPYVNLSGKVANNTADYTLQLKDLKNKERYLIVGNIKANGVNNEIKLNDKLILNYENWSMDPRNLIRLGKNGFYANAVALSKEGNSITLQSQSNVPNAPLALDFKDFKIETITNVVQKGDMVIGGTLNGKALIKDLNKRAVFTADMEIANFSFKKDTVGTIKINVNNQIANTYTAVVGITGQGNQVNLNGNYNNTNDSFDMDLNMEKLNLKSIQGFTMGNITSGKGYFSGQFKIKGTSKEPKVAGDLQFNEIAFKITQLNSYFKSMNDKVSVNETGIAFDSFTVSDEENNVLVIDGKMNTTNFMDYGFNFDVKSDNFKAVNSKEKDNKLFYGKLYLDSRLKVRGDISKPIVEGKIKVNKDTKLSIVLPQQDPSLVDREGIIEFVDQDDPTTYKNVFITEIDSIRKTQFKGVEALVNIEIDKEAELNLIIDKGNGDYLKLKGEARLTGGIDPSGKTTLTGRYEFTEGTYEMTFNVIKRKFDIKEGSYILWTGEPTTADINITAVYKTDAAPIELVGDQLGDITDEVRNTYKQRIPFETNLMMKGDLMKPEISFDIVLPEGNNSVATEIINTTQTKLAQLRQEPSELNKQVFALLLLNRFIGQNPFASQSGGASAESLARQSASKILSQQLTNIAGDLIKGIELDFDLESTEDYTTGELQNKTDLNVGLSKQLLDDRLKVTIGSTFGLEGQAQTNQETNTIAGDVSAEYKLTKDGRYKVRAYRKNQYQVALQGQVVETGVAFVITMNYNKFKELFKKSKEKKSRLKAQALKKKEKKTNPKKK